MIARPPLRAISAFDSVVEDGDYLELTITSALQSEVRAYREPAWATSFVTTEDSTGDGVTET